MHFDLYICIMLGLLMLLPTIINSYPTGYELAKTNFIYKADHQTSYLTKNVIQTQGSYTISGFQSSTSITLKPFFTVTHFQTYTYNMTRSLLFIKVNILTVAGGATTYQIVYEFTTNTLTTLKIRILFFNDILLDIFYSFQVSYFPVFQTSNQIQLTDLRVLFMNSSFVYNRDPPVIYGHTVQRQEFNLHDCFQPGGNTVNFALFNQTHIQFDYTVAKAYCTPNFKFQNLVINVIMYSPLWLNQRTNLLILNDFSSGGSQFTSNYGTCQILSGSYNIPQDFVIYGLKAFRMWWGGFQFKIKYIQTFNIGPPSTVDVTLKRLGGGGLSMTYWTIAFIQVICPITSYFDPVSNACLSACPSKNYADPALLKFKIPTCQFCHYSCLTCLNGISCQSCDAIIDHRTLTTNSPLCEPLPRYYDTGSNSSITLSCYYSCYTCISGLVCNSCDLLDDHRQLNMTTSLCDPIIGYYDDGLLNSIAKKCHPICRSCEIKDRYCTSCWDQYRLYGYLCLKAGCLSFTLKNNALFCIACDSYNHFVYNPFDGTCSCQIGYKGIYSMPNNVLIDCQNICGDGIFVEQQQCDDGNELSNDGCSQCKEQQDFICSNTSPSNCVLYHNFVIFRYNYAYRVENENKFILSYLLLPSHKGIKNMKLKDIVKLNITQSISKNIEYSYNLQNGQLLLRGEFYKDLQNQYLSSEINFDKTNKFKSQPKQFKTINKLNGVNYPLIIEGQNQKQIYLAQANINLILIVILLIQFIVGSYFHKMIGIQTIHVVQIFCFMKMLVNENQNNLLYSLNNYKYSINGYIISKIIFNLSTQVGTNLGLDQYSTEQIQFVRIGMSKYYLININLFLFLFFVAVMVYLVFLCRKYYKRSCYMGDQLPATKDQYIDLKRKCNWTYNHVIFPLIMFISMITFFNIVCYLKSFKKYFTEQPDPSHQYRDIIIASFSIEILIYFISLSIYCYQIFQSYNSYFNSKKTKKQKQQQTSKIQKLQYDQNTGDKINYHLFYVMVYLIFILFNQISIISMVLLQNFIYGFQFVLAINSLYFIVLILWRPYHQLTNQHNYLIVFNQFSLLIYIAICYTFEKGQKIDLKIYVSLVSIMLFILGLIIVCGFVRIYIQIKFRKWLEQHETALENNIDEDKQKQRIKKVLKNERNKHKNLYSFQNQLQKFINDNRQRYESINKNNNKKNTNKKNQINKKQQKKTKLNISQINIQKLEEYKYFQRASEIQKLKNKKLYDQFIYNIPNKLISLHKQFEIIKQHNVSNIYQVGNQIKNKDKNIHKERIKQLITKQDSKGGSI